MAEEALSYECPHCQQQVEVASAVLGDTVTCPHCERQFEADAPQARPTDPAGAGPAPGKRAGRVDDTSGAESVLREMHPVVFRNHLFLSGLFALVGLAAVAGLVLGLIGEAVLGLAGMTLLIISLVGFLIALGFYLYQWFLAITITVKVTTERTIVTKGFFSHKMNEVQHDDVRNIQCDQTILERMFNYGDISLSSSGQDYMEIVIDDVPDPQGIIEIIRRHQ